MNCLNCNRQCNKLCSHFIISTSINIVTVNDIDTLIINIPTGVYGANETYCIITAQTIPATATVNMPVAISIGGSTTAVYPLICSKTGLQAVACQVNAHSRYKVCVKTNVTNGSFVVLSGLGSCFLSTLPSLPAPTSPVTMTMLNTLETASNKAVKTTTTKKETISNE